LFQNDRTNYTLSELPLFLKGQYKLEVPVYTVWGACEDVAVLEKLRSGEYKIPNLNIVDEAHSRLLEIGGIKLRLLGLGGAVVMHKLFDNGDGRTTIAGGQGTMWTTLLQIGELIDTANRVYDPTETRIFITHASPTREGLLNQLSVTLKADFSISAGLHFRYGSSYNEFSVNPTLDHYRGKLAASKASFNDVWETVRSEVEPAVEENESQKRLLSHALDLVNKMPSTANGGNPFGGQTGASAGQVDESAFKNMWNFNLADAAFGWLVLDIDQGRIGTEMRAQGFNFSHRSSKSVQRPVGATAYQNNDVTSAQQYQAQQPREVVNQPPPPQQQQQQQQQQPNRGPQSLPARSASIANAQTAKAAPQQDIRTQPMTEKPAQTNGVSATDSAQSKAVERPSSEQPAKIPAIFIPSHVSGLTVDKVKAVVPKEYEGRILEPNGVRAVNPNKVDSHWLIEFDSFATVDEIIENKIRPVENDIGIHKFNMYRAIAHAGHSGQSHHGHHHGGHQGSRGGSTRGSTRGGYQNSPSQSRGDVPSDGSTPNNKRDGQESRGSGKEGRVGNRGRGRGGRDVSSKHENTNASAPTSSAATNTPASKS